MRKVPEVNTAGTPTFPAALAYPAFRNANFVHRVSPGTIVYSDATTLAQLPNAYGYRPAVLVVARVVSHPRPGIVTCDAGHKAVISRRRCADVRCRRTSRTHRTCTQRGASADHGEGSERRLLWAKRSICCRGTSVRRSIISTTR